MRTNARQAHEGQVLRGLEYSWCNPEYLRNSEDKGPAMLHAPGPILFAMAAIGIVALSISAAVRIQAADERRGPLRPAPIDEIELPKTLTAGF
jgi:hypothetical protein